MPDCPSSPLTGLALRTVITSAQGRDHELVGRLELCLVVAARPELRAVEQRLQHCADIATGGQEFCESLATSAGSGRSETKYSTSWVEMKRAVEG
jgi:hypothetical protein